MLILLFPFFSQLCFPFRHVHFVVFSLCHVSPTLCCIVIHLNKFILTLDADFRNKSTSNSYVTVKSMSLRYEIQIKFLVVKVFR